MSRPPDNGAVPKGHARYILAVMVGINFLNYLDRWVASAAAPLIQKEFTLTDFEVGLLGTAFLLVYAVAALPFGFWADRGVRKRIIGIGVTIWSLATVISGFAGSYVQLFLSRAVLGIGEASYYPAGTSLMSDYFPQETRGRAMSIWGAGTAFGIAVGFAGGGIVAERFGWRYAFFFTALPGLVFAVLAFTMREPLRGAVERLGPKVDQARQVTVRAFLNLLRIPTLRWTILSQTVLFFVLASNAFWLPTLLARRFDMSVGKAGTLSGAVIVLGGLIGTLGGGWLADRWAKKSPNGHVKVGMIGFLIASVTICVAILAPYAIFLPFFLITVVAMYMHSGPFTAIGQNVVSPTLRASSVTLLLFISHVFGDSYSTAAVGALSDALGKNLQVALLITSTPLLLVAAGFAALALRTCRPDVEAMEATWARGRPVVPVESPAQV